MRVYFQLEKCPKPGTGTEVDTVVRYTEGATDPGSLDRDEWCNVDDLDKLFGACASRWGSNWDLDKVCTAIREANFE